MTSGFKITAIGGHVEFVNTGHEAYLVMLGETQGGQRRRIHVELTIENIIEIRNVAQAFLKSLDIPPHDPRDEAIFGPRRNRLSAVDDDS